MTQTTQTVSVCRGRALEAHPAGLDLVLVVSLLHNICGGLILAAAGALGRSEVRGKCEGRAHLHGVCLPRGRLSVGEDGPVVTGQHIWNDTTHSTLLLLLFYTTSRMCGNNSD